MADARYSHGVYVGLNRPKVQLDSPVLHGWTRCGVDDKTGFDVFQLGNAYARACTPQERFDTGYDCFVNIGDDTYGYSGGWQYITADVRKMQELPEPQRSEPYFLPGYKIPAAAFKSNA